jgi:hypothetical protein
MKIYRDTLPRPVIRAVLTAMALSLVSAAIAAETAAQEFDPYTLYGGIHEKFSVSGGVLFGSHSTTARLDSETLGLGTTIDLEDVLGLQTDTRNVRADAYIRLGKRHKLGLGYISLTRNAAFTIDEEIQWGDETYPVSATVATTLKLDLVPFRWQYSLVRSERVDFALSLGFFTMFTKAGVTGEGTSESASSINLPLPVLGANVDWALAEKLFLDGGVEYFSITIGGISGNWSEFRGGVRYYFLPNLGVGAGYRSINLEVDATGEIGDGTGVDKKLFFDYGFKGPQIYLTVSF